MVKGIINSFDHMELSLVINLTKGGNWAIPQPPLFATGYVRFATTFLYQVAIPCYLQTMLISNTGIYMYLPTIPFSLLVTSSHVDSNTVSGFSMTLYFDSFTPSLKCLNIGMPILTCMHDTH